MTNNTKVSNAPLSDIQVKTTLTADGHVQHINIDDAVSTNPADYSVRIDEGATYTYIGYADPGVGVASALWKIKRLTNADSTILWADGNSSFDNVWNDRASLSYS